LPCTSSVTRCLFFGRRRSLAVDTNSIYNSFLMPHHHWCSAMVLWFSENSCVCTGILKDSSRSLTAKHAASDDDFYVASTWLRQTVRSLQGTHTSASILLRLVCIVHTHQTEGTDITLVHQIEGADNPQDGGPRLLVMKHRLGSPGLVVLSRGISPLLLEDQKGEHACTVENVYLATAVVKACCIGLLENMFICIVQLHGRF
jgi:hypothetical protein